MSKTKNHSTFTPPPFLSEKANKGCCFQVINTVNGQARTNLFCLQKNNVVTLVTYMYVKNNHKIWHAPKTWLLLCQKNLPI